MAIVTEYAFFDKRCILLSMPRRFLEEEARRAQGVIRTEKKIITDAGEYVDRIQRKNKQAELKTPTSSPAPQSPEDSGRSSKSGPQPH